MAGIVICMAQIFIFVCVKLYNTMVTYMGFSGTIFSYFAASACAMLYSKYILPETKGKTLDEIENLFKKNDRVSRVSDGETNEGFTVSSENITVVTRWDLLSSIINLLKSYPVQSVWYYLQLLVNGSN